VSGIRQGFHDLIIGVDREEALKDDFHFEASSYSYDEEDEWDDDEQKWTEEEQPGQENVDSKDESTAYLEFLNEEVNDFWDNSCAACY
jgi:importin-7